MHPAMSLDATAPVTRLWLAHHHPAQYERCVPLGRHRVCRRCAVLYPTAVVVMALSLAGLHWPALLDSALLWLLPAPAVAEFVGEHLGVVRHHPRRLVGLTLLAAPALGRGFARYLAHPGDRLWWNVVATYVLFGVAAAVIAQWRHSEARATAVPRYELLPSAPSSAVSTTAAASSPSAISPPTVAASTSISSVPVSSVSSVSESVSSSAGPM
jgi:hypothetical protein